MPLGPSLGSTQDDVRRNNLARLLRRLHTLGPASRSDLVAMSGLNRSTVGVLVSELVDAGLVSEGAGTSGSVGRPSLRVAPVPESAVVVALDLRVERTVGALVGLGGHVFARSEQRHRRTGLTPQAALRQMTALTAQLLGKAPLGARWVGTGVGVPGVVESGMVVVAPNLGWADVALAERLAQALEEEFQTVPPVSIGNDADLGAVAEHARGAAAGSDAVVYLSGEVGIGGGIVLDGRLLGPFGGEVGHMVVNPSGVLCRCGSIGCWETVIGRDALLQAAGRPPASDEIADLVRAAHSGSRRDRAALDEAGEWLGLGLANLANLLSPEVVVLGGHLRLVFPEVRDIVHDRVRRALAPRGASMRVVVPALEGDSTLIGAAEAALVPVLTDPVGALERSGALIAS